MLKRFISLGLIVLFLFTAISLNASSVKYDEDQIRIIPVKVRYSESWLKWHGSRVIIRAQKVVERISRIYNKEFGIRLQIADRPRLTKINTDGQLAYDTFLITQQIIAPQNGIVIYFTSKSYLKHRGLHQWGRAKVDELAGKYILISDEKEGKLGGLHIGASRKKLAIIGIHEIAHLFGCTHVETENSVMKAYLSLNAKFDEQTRTMIFKNKWTAFTSESGQSDSQH